ncbi:hypothetical protein JOM56_005232, partial [Amanita muscaria]
VAASFMGRYFLLEGCGKPNERRGARFLTELRAGLTTWVSLANFMLILLFTWIILGHEGSYGLYCKLTHYYRRPASTLRYRLPSMHPLYLILVAHACALQLMAVPMTPIYLSCVDDVKRELITSTATISALASILMGLLANASPQA